MAFSVRSTGCDSRVPGEPRVVAAQRARSLHTFPSPTDSRHGNCRVCPLGCLPAFIASGRSKPPCLRPTTASPAVSEGTVSLSFLRHIRRERQKGDSDVGREERAAIAGGRCIRFAEYQIHIRGVTTFSSQVSFRRWLRRGAGLTRFPWPKPGTEMGDALIFDYFRARLHGQRPAMAASGASRSTQ